MVSDLNGKVVVLVVLFFVSLLRFMAKGDVHVLEIITCLINTDSIVGHELQ